MLKIESVTVV